MTSALAGSAVAMVVAAVDTRVVRSPRLADVARCIATRRVVCCSAIKAVVAGSFCGDALIWKADAGEAANDNDRINNSRSIIISQRYGIIGKKK